MKPTRTLLLSLAATAISSAATLTAPPASAQSASDLFQNSNIVSNSTLYPTFNARDLFGTALSGIEPGNVIFADGAPGAVTTVVFDVGSLVNISGYNLFLQDDTSSPTAPGPSNRGATRFRLFLGNGTGGTLLSDVTIMGAQSTYAASFGNQFLQVSDSFASTSGQIFTAEFTQDGANGGVRALELDAIPGQAVPEPTTFALIALGGVAVLAARRKKA